MKNADNVIIEINTKHIEDSKIFLNNKEIIKQLKLTKYDFQLLNSSEKYYNNLENLIKTLVK